MSVHGADDLQDASIRRELACRTVSNAIDSKANFRPRGLMVSGSLIADGAHRFAQSIFKLLQLFTGCGSQVDTRLGALWNGVDRSTPLNDANIERSTGRFGHRNLAEVGQGAECPPGP